MFVLWSDSEFDSLLNVHQKNKKWELKSILFRKQLWVCTLQLLCAWTRIVEKLIEGFDAKKEEKLQLWRKNSLPSGQFNVRRQGFVNVFHFGCVCYLLHYLLLSFLLYSIREIIESYSKPKRSSHRKIWPSQTDSSSFREILLSRTCCFCHKLSVGLWIFFKEWACLEQQTQRERNIKRHFRISASTVKGRQVSEREKEIERVH